MKKTLILLFASSILLLNNAFATLLSEKIYTFDSKITLNDDASIDITETLFVYANQGEILHGIVRHLPISYHDSYNITRSTHYRIQQILLNGVHFPYHIQQTNKQLSIYIGDRNAILSPGDYSFTIQYHVSNAINFLQDADELYWNITGNNWSFPIEKAQATIQLPQGATIKLYNGYTGFQGQRGKDFTVTQPAENQIIFTTTKILQPGEGLTIAVAMPKGIVHSPTWGELLSDQFNSWQYFLMVIALLLFAYYLIAWHLCTRNLSKNTIIPLFTPPKDLTPEAIRFIYLMRFDMKCFTAAIVNMAINGFLTIQKEDSGFSLVKNNQSFILSNEEKATANELFASGSSISLSQTNNVSVKRARKALNNNLIDQYQTPYFFTNLTYLIPGFLLTSCAFAIVLFTANTISDAYMAIGTISFWSFFCGYLFFQAYNSIKQAVSLVSITTISRAIYISLFAIMLAIGEIIIINQFSSSIAIFSVPILFLIIVLDLLFYQLLRTPTPAGCKIINQIEGFKLFLATTEKYRLDQLNAPNKTPELFEKYLPYAIALNVENEWATQFEAILRNAGIDPSTYHPAWYSGPEWRTPITSLPAFISAGLGASLVLSTMSVSSSASSGGGSSGGGGGGGGGGGW